MLSDMEQKKYTDYYIDFNRYMKKCVIPEVLAHQLYSYYVRGLLNGDTLKQYINSIKDVFNINFEFDDVRVSVERILRIKYNLKIVKDEPLVMKSLLKRYS